MSLERLETDLRIRQNMRASLIHRLGEETNRDDRLDLEHEIAELEDEIAELEEEIQNLEFEEDDL